MFLPWSLKWRAKMQLTVSEVSTLQSRRLAIMQFRGLFGCFGLTAGKMLLRFAWICWRPGVHTMQTGRSGPFAAGNCMANAVVLFSWFHQPIFSNFLQVNSFQTVGLNIFELFFLNLPPAFHIAVFISQSLLLLVVPRRPNQQPKSKSNQQW